MAEIKTYPFLRHLRAEPTAHVMRYRGGRLAADGPGLTFWFAPNRAAVAEIPLGDQELPFLFHVRSGDFQQLIVQGVITFRFADPEKVAARIDFTLDLASGNWTETPLERVQGMLVQMAQQYVIDELAASALREILTAGVAPIREVITRGLAAEAGLAELGLEIMTVRVSALAPEGDVEKALQQPTREAIQQQADEATFSRRALAVEKERAISAQATDDEQRLVAQRKADALKLLEAVRVQAERERSEIQSALGPKLLTALAARELAAGLGKVEHLTITPELITPLLSGLANGRNEG